MPIIFQGECSSCGYESPTISDTPYGGVVIDDPSIIKPHATHPADDRVVVLRHPGEQYILEEHGYSYTSATFQGRFLLFKQYFCKSCGHVYETRKLASARLIFGCLPPMLVAIVIGVAVGSFQSSIVEGLFGGLLALLFVSIAIDWMVGVYIRLRYADRAREFRIDRICPKCGSGRATTSGTLKCPECRQLSMKVKAVGMS